MRRLYQVTRSIDRSGKALKQETNPARIINANNSINGKGHTVDLVATQSDSNLLSDFIGISEVFTKAVTTEVRKIINLEDLEKNSKVIQKQLKLSSASLEKL